MAAIRPTANPVGGPTLINAMVPPKVGAPPPAMGAPPPPQMGAPATPGMGAPASPRPNAAPYATADSRYNRNGSGGAMGDSIGGVSAVNPQAGQMDYGSLSPFIDSAYNQAMTRLNPQLDQQSDSFDQSMINRGIGVGSEAYGEAKQQLDFNQNDARQSAAFGAMGFGKDVQSQMFGQDATRSGLANALLRSKWNVNEQGRQFDSGLGERARQFDDQSNRAWDNQGFGQMMGLEGTQFRNRRYNDSRGDYGNSLLMAMLGYGGGQQPQWNADPNSPYNAQLGYEASNYGSRTGLAGSLLGGFGYTGGGG